MIFDDAASKLDANDRNRVVGQLDAWLAGSCSQSRRLASNIRSETALDVDCLIALLESFCNELKRCHLSPIPCWEAACRRHKLKGAPVPAPIPSRLGRALPIERYAKLLAPEVGLSDARAEDMIRRVAFAGATTNRREARLIRRAPLGSHLIWATFREDDPDGDPFLHLPKSTAAMRTALGLAECPETETLVLITWRREGPHAKLSVHRPTVADAEAYPWYRPVDDPGARWGYTEPLPPNPGEHPACPEVVHQVISGETLVFPVSLAV